MPIVRINQRIKQMASGDILSVEASDPAFRADLAAWCKTTGHKMLDFREEASVQYAAIEKGSH